MKNWKPLSVLLAVLTLLPLGNATPSESPEAFIARITTPIGSRGDLSARASDEPTCPNLIIEPWEDCDDANLENGDGCDSNCQYEPAICGNGVLNPGEECDDGNLVAGDGCDPVCEMEPALCGNGLLEPGEECDDGNLTSGDGCSNSCQLEGSPGVTISVGTSTANDTLYAGVPGSIIFKVEAPATAIVADFTFPIKYEFSNGNIMGPVGIGLGAAYMTYSPKAHGTVKLVGWNTGYALAATDPAYTLLGLIAFGTPRLFWTGSGEVWRITFVPLDTGTITVDTTQLPPANSLFINDPDGNNLLDHWLKKTITVVPGLPTGNVNGDQIVNSADLVYLVNYLYREGTPPGPCEARGDVDCSGVINALDIMQSINYVFKAGQKPCNAGGLVGRGVWDCP